MPPVSTKRSRVPAAASGNASGASERGPRNHAAGALSGAGGGGGSTRGRDCCPTRPAAAPHARITPADERGTRSPCQPGRAVGAAEEALLAQERQHAGGD